MAMRKTEVDSGIPRTDSVVLHYAKIGIVHKPIYRTAANGAHRRQKIHSRDVEAGVVLDSPRALRAPMVRAIDAVAMAYARWALPGRASSRASQAYAPRLPWYRTAAIYSPWTA